MILGVHEILGLEEILTFENCRRSTVICYSQTARAYFINRDDFARLLKSFTFDERLLYELGIKQSI